MGDAGSMCDRRARAATSADAQDLKKRTSASGRKRSVATLAQHELLRCRQAPQYQAKPLFDKIQEAHGDKSDKQVTHIVREFVGRTKTNTVKITDFNQTWTEGVRVLKHNGMELPKKIIVNLYLISLGARYRTLEAAVSVLPPERRTISHVMRLAVDHSASGNGDEAEHDSMATQRT